MSGDEGGPGNEAGAGSRIKAGAGGWKRGQPDMKGRVHNCRTPNWLKKDRFF